MSRIPKIGTKAIFEWVDQALRVRKEESTTRRKKSFRVMVFQRLPMNLTHWIRDFEGPEKEEVRLQIEIELNLFHFDKVSGNEESICPFIIDI